MLKKKKDNVNDESNLKNDSRANNGSQTGNQTGGESGQTAGDKGSQGNDSDQAENKGTGTAADGESSQTEASAEEALREELSALNDKYLRLFAEFDNFKRRSTRERIELVGTASKNVILALLPVMDDFDRARKSMENTEDVQALREGIDLIITKFQNILSQQGVREMNAVGEPFDADLHEAVTSIPAPSEELKGKVVDQLEKGYYLNDKVIRFAKVLVGA